MNPQIESFIWGALASAAFIHFIHKFFTFAP